MSDENTTHWEKGSLTAKPVMGSEEASFLQVQAGQRARAKAEQAGASPDAVEAVADAASGPVVIAGHELKPVTQGVLWALQKMGRLFAEYVEAENITDSDEVEMMDTALTTIIFKDARRAWSVMQQPDGFAKLLAEADQLMWEMDVEDSTQLSKHFEEQLARVARLRGDAEPSPGKPQGAGQQMTRAGASSASQLVQDQTDSTSSNGSWQSTTSPSQTPSGNGPSTSPTSSSPSETNGTAETQAPTTP